MSKGQQPRTRIHLVVDGKPVPKLRVRWTKLGGRYNPNDEKESTMRTTVAKKLKVKPGSPIHKKGVGVKMTIKFHMARPNDHFTNNRRGAGRMKPAHAGRKAHVFTPDIDNLVKFVLDSLDTVAYASDKQVVRIVASKEYDNIGSCGGRTEITLAKAIA